LTVDAHAGRSHSSQAPIRSSSATTTPSSPRPQPTPRRSAPARASSGRKSRPTLAEGWALGRAIAAVRSACGLNQRQLAAAAGLHGSAISDYERGKTQPELATLHRLFAAMQCSHQHFQLTLDLVHALSRAGTAARIDADRDSLAHRLATGLGDAFYQSFYQVFARLGLSDPRRDFESAPQGPPTQ
jgi:transcriptional regulator with XRE-family HTH domain